MSSPYSDRTVAATRALTMATIFFAGTFTVGILGLAGLPFVSSIPITATAGIANAVALSVLNTRVGYRWFDVFLGLIPIYGVAYFFRVTYRGMVLDAFDDVPPTAVDAYRTVASAQLIKSGVSRGVANAAALCLFPIDDDVEVNPNTAENLRSISRAFATQVHDTNPSELFNCSRSTLQSLRDASVQAQDDYYEARFNAGIELLDTSELASEDRFGSSWALTIDPDSIVQTAEERLS